MINYKDEDNDKKENQDDNGLDVEKILKLTKEKIAISNFEKAENIECADLSKVKVKSINKDTISKEIIENYNEKVKNKMRNYFALKTVVVSFICVFCISGMVFAKEISKMIVNKYNTGKGVETAINNGYNAEYKDENNENKEEQNSDKKIIDLNSNEEGLMQDSIKICVDDLVMDDNYLSITFNVKLSEKIQEKLNKKSYIDVDFPDLLITDDEGYILYSADINKGCEFLGYSTNTSSYDVYMDSDKTFNNGLNTFSEPFKNGEINAIYNIYLEGMEEAFPKSKKLNFDFDEVDIENDADGDEGEILNYKGDWNFSIDIPEKISNRKSIIYNQVNSSVSSDDKVIECKVNNTGTSVKIRLSSDGNLAQKESPQSKLINMMESANPSAQIRDYFMDELIESEEYKKYSEALRKSYQTNEVYIENDNGDRFDLSEGPYCNGGGYYTDDGYYEISYLLDLTQNDLTNKLKLHLKYFDNEIDFILEKGGEE